jgi:hypothetical protein
MMHEMCQHLEYNFPSQYSCKLTKLTFNSTIKDRTKMLTKESYTLLKNYLKFHF